MSFGSGTVIKLVLALQMGVGAILVAGDMASGWQGFGLRPNAPAMDQPVAPGDQRRRYRPDAPGREMPGRPFPETGDLPPRLRVDPVEYEGAPALRILGTIAPGDGARLAETLAAHDILPPILLHSPGGSVADALALGRYFRDAGARVTVAAGDLCLSACPYLLAGGAERMVDPDGSVGVHQHYFGENTVLPAFMAVEDIQRGQGVVMEYLVEMGIDPQVMQPALMTPPEEIYILLPEELENYGLVSGAT